MVPRNLPSITRRSALHTCRRDRNTGYGEFRGRGGKPAVTTLEEARDTDTGQPRYSLFIDGRRVEAASGRRYDSVDPFLGQPWASAADGDAADVDAAGAGGRGGGCPGAAGPP